MKFFNFLCFPLLFIFISNSLAEPLIDINGEELSSGNSYYVVSALWGPGGGGLTIDRYQNEECPSHVTQEPIDRRFGIPVIISPVGSKEDVISLSSPVNIKFKFTLIPCAESEVWKVGNVDEETGANLLVVGGEEWSEDSTFKIEKGLFPGSYQIKDASGSKYLSITYADGKRIVTVSSEGIPFYVVFRNPDSDTGNSYKGVLARA